MTTVCEAVIKQLKTAGVKYVFGIPGGPWIPFMDEMQAQGIEFVLVANEGAAAFMADVTSRLTTVPGICHGTFGPGATNLSTGVGGALLDRSALIAMTSEVPDNMMSRTTQMRIDHQKLFEAITKKTCRLNCENPVSDVYHALNLSLSDIPGPVHIGIPSDKALAAISDHTALKKPQPRKSVQAEKQELDKVARAIKDAERPILAVGLTAAREGLREEVSGFAEKLHAPVVITPMSKGIIDENSPLYQGVLFHACSGELIDIIAKADLIVAIGYDPVEFNFEAWIPENIPVVSIDVSPADIDQSDYTLIAQAVGDIKQALGILSREAVRTQWEEKELPLARKRIHSRFDVFRDRFGPVTALAVLREILPDDGILTLDVGAHLHVAGQFWPTPSLNRVVMTNGWSSMGFGIPAAIAASLSCPGQEVACVTGDGGFLMMAGELITARRLHLNTVFVVFADRRISLIAVKQEWQDVLRYQTKLYEGEYFQSDFFFGVPVFRADSEQTMEKALKQAFVQEGPAIVEAVIDHSQYSELVEKKYK